MTALVFLRRFIFKLDIRNPLRQMDGRMDRRAKLVMRLIKARTERRNWTELTRFIFFTNRPMGEKGSLLVIGWRVRGLSHVGRRRR